MSGSCAETKDGGFFHPRTLYSSPKEDAVLLESISLFPSSGCGCDRVPNSFCSLPNRSAKEIAFPKPIDPTAQHSDRREQTAPRAGIRGCCPLPVACPFSAF
jgi:hypothetical protein